MVEPGQDLLLAALSESGISPNDLFDVDGGDAGLATPTPPSVQQQQPPSTTTFVLNQINQLPTLGSTIVMTKTPPATTNRQTITLTKFIQTTANTRPSVSAPAVRNAMPAAPSKDQVQLKDLLKNNSLNELMKLKPPANIAQPVATAATDVSNGAVKKESSNKEVARIWINDMKMRSFSPTMKVPVVKEEDEPEEEDEEEMGHAETYAEYMPIKLKIGLRHPDAVVETSSLSSVTPPDVWYKTSISEETIDNGWLSALQLEAVTYAAQLWAGAWGMCSELISGAAGGGGGGGGGMGLGGGGGGGGTAMRILGGVISAISEAAAQYNPEPPPPRSHYSNIEANESEEVRQFRKLFVQLAGDDMEVSATELMNILNKVVTRHPDLKTDGFGIDTCRSMVAVMDSDTTGKLGFEEFKYLWNNIKKWQAIYKRFDTDRSGTIGSHELPGAFEAAGFHLNEHLYSMIIRRYADESGNMDFDNFISCLVRLDAMFRAFKSLDKNGTGQIQVNIQEWLQLTMYS